MASRTDPAQLEQKMAELIDAFESHPQVQPPNPHPTAFFLLDFVRNTHRMLKTVDAAKYAAGDNDATETVKEVIGRNQFANLLLNDSSGKLSLMTGGDPSNPIDFGPDIKAKASALN
ncbi:uncharacterized protein N7484_007368 [Penicillium longicatenatum]|uniref:uncharacterized protein n=1 Tax=Penicillium longicatenatum TaxID=1561947 RepID=UPI0025482FFB|nr:uncharacterized protein N7484_007368 [Penicillium longicatenatum]KAJ5639506.1 hypothetical protein N7484_007368 [Penicillium longicatenatum]KAJ5652180.1 hypothetical protein N7507_009606 [Penicillium longicatenatum]